ncbi:MAG TPA: alkaline phosphatase family protein [Pseudonocardiaceae bacterium]|nr:alkaline phosphatase family protein [Pseudonocardiaceae bacterium]
MAQLVGHEGLRLLKDKAGPVIERALAVDPAGTGSLADIEHIVLLMQENRSFDHYFGTMSGVRGFDEASSAFRQYGYEPGAGVSANGYLNPFRLNTLHGATLNGDAINDPAHEWGPQHRAWHDGAMDRWVSEHISASGPHNGPVVMGYYTREDIPVHHALADAFTICDNYFSSVMGPTDPNRLFWISGSIDPAGEHGGPALDAPDDPPPNVFSWPTYPEKLEEAGVSWKVYGDKGGSIARRFLSGLLYQFTAFADPTTPLAEKGLTPRYPDDFRRDVAAGTLPSVSWVVPPFLTCEHPTIPPAFGAVGLVEILDILTSNPAVWEKTALIISYDENGGFFDHVAPPVPPPGTPGEYLTGPLAGVKDADGIAGPVGLGFRVPCLVISPYSRGGRVASETFDHTSQLRLVERRFGVPVPNLSDWRRNTVGDLVSAFDFQDRPRFDKPKLPSPDLGALKAAVEGNVSYLLGFLNHGRSYPVPPNAMPHQEQQPPRVRQAG